MNDICTINFGQPNRQFFIYTLIIFLLSFRVAVAFVTKEEKRKTYSKIVIQILFM